MYTIVVNGKPQGPYTLEELKQLKLSPGTFVRKPGMDDYKEAHELVELRALFGFAFPKFTPQYFASFDQRLMAWAIDYFLITVIYAVLVFAGFLLFESQKERIMILIIGGALIPLTKFVYSVFADASKTQGTIGKKLMDIKVTDSHAARISIGVSLLRNASKILSSLSLCLGYIYSFIDKKRRCFHDIIAETLVIKDRLV